MQGLPRYVVLRHLDFDDIAIVFMVLREFIDFIVRIILVVCIPQGCQFLCPIEW